MNLPYATNKKGPRWDGESTAGMSEGALDGVNVPLEALLSSLIKGAIAHEKSSIYDFIKKLKDIPAPGLGLGCHPALLSAANIGVRTTLDDRAIESLIRAAIPGTRELGPEEIPDAIRKARADAGQSTASNHAPISPGCGLPGDGARDGDVPTAGPTDPANQPGVSDSRNPDSANDGGPALEDKVTTPRRPRRPRRRYAAISASKGRARRCRCGSHMCPDCLSRIGRGLRWDLWADQGYFRIPAMLTITVRRRSFNSPGDAYDLVMDERFLARLLTKELGIQQWVAVMEPQEGGGEIWPSWHILIDKSPLPTLWYSTQTKQTSIDEPRDLLGWSLTPHFLDLNKLYELVGEIGWFKLSRTTDSQGDAIFSTMEYMTKAPPQDYPLWMRKRRQHLQMFACSTGLMIDSGKRPANASGRNPTGSKPSSPVPGMYAPCGDVAGKGGAV